MHEAHHHCPHLLLHWKAVTGLQTGKDWKPVSCFTVSAWSHPELKQHNIAKYSHLHYLGKCRSCSIKEETARKKPPLQLHLLVVKLPAQRKGRYYYLLCSTTSYLQALLLPTFPCRNFQVLFQQPQGEILPPPMLMGNLPLTPMGSLFHTGLGGIFAWVSAAGLGPGRGSALLSAAQLLT